MKQPQYFSRQAILNTLHDIPDVKPGAKRIVSLVRQRGRVVGYELSDHTIVSKERGVELARQGQIAGVGIGIRKGTEYLKSLPDERDGNNLGSLPSIPPREE